MVAHRIINSLLEQFCATNTVMDEHYLTTRFESPFDAVRFAIALQMSFMYTLDWESLPPSTYSKLFGKEVCSASGNFIFRGPPISIAVQNIDFHEGKNED